MLNFERLPQYRSHKIVRAGQIAEIIRADNSALSAARLRLVTLDSVAGQGPRDPETEMTVDGHWMTKHSPRVGGYFVVYEDGYTSFSPAEAFEGGYTRV